MIVMTETTYSSSASTVAIVEFFQHTSSISAASKNFSPSRSILNFVHEYQAKLNEFDVKRKDGKIIKHWLTYALHVALLILHCSSSNLIMKGYHESASITVRVYLRKCVI